MAKWNSPEWEDLCNGKTCPICLNGKPRGIILEFNTTYLTSSAASAMKGYCCVVSKNHVVELHDLDVQAAGELMADVLHVGRAIQKVTGAC